MNKAAVPLRSSRAPGDVGIESAIKAWGLLPVSTFNVPTIGYVGAPYAICVPRNQFERTSVFGAVLASAVPRTQGLLVDQHRRFLLDFARDFGEVKTARPEADIETTAPLANTVTELRRQSGLPAAEIARMAGIQRRQLYNLVDGGKTTPARERRIRSLASFVDQLHERFGDASVVRSVLLAPIGSDLRSFVDLATDGISIQDASRALETYLSRRQGRVRQYVQTPRRAREQERAAARLVDDTRDIFPDSE